MYQAKFLALSPYLNGYILTNGSNSESFEIGDFNFKSCVRISKFNSLKFVLFCLYQALKIKKNGGVDCIISYDPLKTGFIGCLLKKLLATKLIVEVNGVYTSPVVWEDTPNSLSRHVKKWIIPKLMTFVFFFSDGIKLQFPTQIDEFKKVTKGKVKRVFSDWVPTSKFKNIKENKELLLIGFPFKIKGVDVLIEAFKQVAPQFPDWNLKILGWYPNVNELMKAIGSHPQIIHSPPVNYSEVVQHIGECGVFVLPSRTDARPRVLIESAAAGKPRVGSNVDGIPLLIEDGVDGFLVEPEDVNGLAIVLERLMRDPNLRKKIGTNAQDRARSDFSEYIYISNTIDFLNNVSCEPKSRHSTED